MKIYNYGAFCFKRYNVKNKCACGNKNHKFRNILETWNLSRTYRGGKLIRFMGADTTRFHFKFRIYSERDK